MPEVVRLRGGPAGDWSPAPFARVPPGWHVQAGIKVGDVVRWLGMVPIGVACTEPYDVLIRPPAWSCDVRAVYRGPGPLVPSGAAWGPVTMVLEGWGDPARGWFEWSHPFISFEGVRCE